MKNKRKRRPNSEFSIEKKMEEKAREKKGRK